MAHEEFFGDSYQYAHRVLLHAIARPHEWKVHPMLFRNKGGGLNLDKYAKFLDLPREAVLEKKKHGPALKRGELEKDVEAYRNKYLFLDPDTGIDEGEGAGEHGGEEQSPTNGKTRSSTKHVGQDQLSEIANARNGKIVLVHDHAYRREKIQGTDGKKLKGKDKALELVERKLRQLWNNYELHCAAVIVRTGPCVCYIWVSKEWREVDTVSRRLRCQLPMPDWRLVPCPCPKHLPS